MKIQNTGIENKITKSIEKNKLIQSKILKSIHWKISCAYYTVIRKFILNNPT